MCELTACGVFASYMLDAFSVAPYFWPSGEAGSGKTTFLDVLSELGYLGMKILAASSYPTLRDMADYGALLCFDDAEGVMDVRKTDPDKRALLLAGNRKGATIAVKELRAEQWVTRVISTFCMRAFSAIRLPDTTLASRNVIVPLIRSADGNRTKANPMDPAYWPEPRQRLVDDLWSVALQHMHELPAVDREAARLASLQGRNLEPWRALLGVAGWLDDHCGVRDLYARLEKLSVAYQQERTEFECNDRSRILYEALLRMTANCQPNETTELAPGAVSDVMNALAKEEGLEGRDGKPFATAQGVGYDLKRQRFRRGKLDGKSRPWQVVRQDVINGARTHGIDTEKTRTGEQ
jgi:hypothetical protein